MKLATSCGELPTTRMTWLSGVQGRTAGVSIGMPRARDIK
jgi:hypothetical protein